MLLPKVLLRSFAFLLLVLVGAHPNGNMEAASPVGELSDGQVVGELTDGQPVVGQTTIQSVTEQTSSPPVVEQTDGQPIEATAVLLTSLPSMTTHYDTATVTSINVSAGQSPGKFAESSRGRSESSPKTSSATEHGSSAPLAEHLSIQLKSKTATTVASSS